MHNNEQLKRIKDKLLEVRQTMNPYYLFPVVVPEARELVPCNPYAFALATCLDRATKAEIIWTIPFDIRNELGHIDPFLINRMSIIELSTLFDKLQRKPRYKNDAPRTVKELTDIVVRECECDASKLWLGKMASEVKRTFQSIHGVGLGIADRKARLGAAADQPHRIKYRHLTRG